MAFRNNSLISSYITVYKINAKHNQSSLVLYWVNMKNGYNVNVHKILSILLKITENFRQRDAAN